MKRQVLLIAAACCLFSCDYIMKTREEKDEQVKTSKKVVIGTDKDEMGCVKSAGYKWSYITKECIRPIEEGYRLNSIAHLEGESSLQSVFVVFEDDGDRAELFFPNEGKSVMLKKDSKNGPYKDSHWQLQSSNGYRLLKDGELLYAGAAVQEGQITGDDKEES